MSKLFIGFNSYCREGEIKVESDKPKYHCPEGEVIKCRNDIQEYHCPEGEVKGQSDIQKYHSQCN